jgi:DNA-binding NarL/FixJ family response regulator
MNDLIKILIADDHKLFRSGLISMFDDIKDICIVGEVENGAELIEACSKLKPDIVVADISMPKLSGLEAAKILLQKDNKIKILFLTMYDSEEYIYYSLKAGAKGLVGKNAAKGELVYAIKKIFDNEIYFGSEWNDLKLKELANRYNNVEYVNTTEINADLTGREMEILLYIADGLTSNEIAEKLSLSKRTIDYHRTNIMSKQNLKSLPELIRFAMQMKFHHKN